MVWQQNGIFIINILKEIGETSKASLLNDTKL